MISDGMNVFDNVGLCTKPAHEDVSSQVCYNNDFVICLGFKVALSRSAGMADYGLRLMSITGRI